MRAFRNILFTLLCITAISCQNKDSALNPPAPPQPPPEQSNCAPGVPFKISIASQYGTEQQAADDIYIKDISQVQLDAIIYDDCGDRIQIVKPLWSLLTAKLGVLEVSTDGSATFIVNQGASAPTNPALITANYEGLETSINVHIAWTISDITSLYRWYKPDSLRLEEGDRVGIANHTEVPDLGNKLEPFAAVSGRDREPMFSKEAFKRSLFRFCGIKLECSKSAGNHSLRIASTSEELKNTDLTIVFVAARNTDAATYILNNQKAETSSGLFIGWVDKNIFRVSLSGPNEKPVADYKMPDTDSVEQLNIWVVSIGVEPNRKTSGIRIFRNGVEVASNSNAFSDSGVGNGLIPYLGSDLSNNNKSDFYLGEFIIYKKVLSVDEMDKVNSYLKDRYL